MSNLSAHPDQGIPPRPETRGECRRLTRPAATPFDPPASGYAEMNLYLGDPPNYLATAPSESVDPTSGVIRDVSVPTLRRYPVDDSKSTGV